jgi:hypothetical protein
MPHHKGPRESGLALIKELGHKECEKSAEQQEDDYEHVGNWR